jgi:hypothetical protein
LGAQTPCMGPCSARALAQPQHGTRSALGIGTPATAGQYPILTAHAQGSGVPFHQAPTWSSDWCSFGWSSHLLHSPGHNSLLPWSPDELKTPTDAEWSQLSIPRGRGAIGRSFAVIDLVTDPYRLRGLCHRRQNFPHCSRGPACWDIPRRHTKNKWSTRCAARGTAPGRAKSQGTLDPPLRYSSPGRRPRRYSFLSA